jgi:hypothetical protein
MKRHMLAATTVVALLFLLTLGASRASASVITFQLTSDHCTGGCIPVAGASAGTITITDGSSGVVSVNVTLNSGYQFVDTGFQTDFGFNLTGTPTITFSGVTSGFTPNSNPESAGSLKMDGTGVFEYGVQCTGCGSGGSAPLAGPLNFTITDGATLSTASFTTNALLQFFAVDLIGPNGNTGAVDASTPSTPVPDGGMTLMLLGGAFVGLETLRRRFRV